MTGRPAPGEAAPYYATYIDKVPAGDIVAHLDAQLKATLPFLAAISEEKSLYRYAPEKWSIRQAWSHVNDTERVFLFRALWFGRGFDSPVSSFDQNVAVPTARADDVSWARHVEEFRQIREATVSFFRNLPADAWDRSGVASGNPVTVRALAYIIAGHVEHHAGVVRERYL